MPDQRLRYTIEADDSKAASANARINAGLATIEKTAVQAGRAAGAALDAMTLAMVKSADAARAFRNTVLTFTEVAASIALATKATTLYSVASENLLNTYRAARLLISPTLFTATTLAIGFAAEETIRLTNARAKLIQQDSLLAARSGVHAALPDPSRSFTAASALSTAERLGSYGVGTLTGSKIGGPAGLVGLVGGINDLADPYDRAALAVKKLGAEGAELLPLLDDNLRRNVERSYELAGALNGPVRESLQRIHETLQGPGRAIRSFGDDLRYLAEIGKQGIVIGVTYAERGARNFINNPPSTGGTESFEPGFGSQNPNAKNGDTLFSRFLGGAIPSYLELQGALPAAPPIGGPVPGLAFGASGVATEKADRVASVYGNSLDGLRSQLGDARSRLDTVLHRFNSAGDNRNQFADSLTRAVLEVNLLEPRVKALEKAAEEAEAVKRGSESINRQLAAEYARPALGRGRPFQLAQHRESVPEDLTRGDISYGLYQTSLGIFGGNRTAERNGLTITTSLREPNLADLEAQQQASDRSTLGSLGRQLAFGERSALLRTRPGGEGRAAQDVYSLRIQAAEKELQITRDLSIYRDRLEEASIDRETRLLEIEKERFDRIRQSAAQLFDSLLSGARNFTDALRRTLIAGLLTPVKEAFSNTVAGIFTGHGGAQTTGGGLLGSFGSFGLGSVLPGAPGGTSGFAGPVSDVYTPGIIGGGQLGIGGGLGTAAQGGLLAKLGLGTGATPGLLGLGASALGLKGAFGIGQASQGSGLLGGAAGKVLAPALGAVSGLVGFGSLAFLFPSLIAAGPAGWIAAAGIGATVGILGSLIKTATEKVHDKVKSIYGVDITEKNILNQILGIAKEGFGGNLDVAIHSPQVRDLVQLYALSTGGRNFGPSPYVPHSGTFVQSGGGFSQLPTFSNGQPFFASSSLANAGSIVIQLDGPATTSLLRGESLDVLKTNSAVVAASVQQANRSSQSRRANAALSLSPGTLTS